MTRIRVRDAHGDERQQALRIALSEPGVAAEQAQKICQLTENFLHRCGGSIGGLHLAEAEGQVVAACAVLDLPGGVSLLMLPTWELGRSVEGLAELLAAASRGARERNSRFAQVMLEPDTAEQVRPSLEQAGLSYLASLQYMQRNAFDPSPIRPVADTNWLTLADTDEQTFAEVIRHTYAESLDCPELTGVRSMQDVLDSHRSAGEFDPLGWYLLEHRGQPAGALITARPPFCTNLEVVYVGLLPQARGQGLGRVCVHRAIQRARDLVLTGVTLAVDAANTPACGMYTAMGFSAYATKDVWIQVFRRADAEGLFALPA